MYVVVVAAAAAARRAFANSGHGPKGAPTSASLGASPLHELKYCDIYMLNI